MDAQREIAKDLLREAWAPLDTLLAAHTAVLSREALTDIIRARELLVGVLVALSEDE